MLGSSTSFPITAVSKRQGCVSSSAPEAEIVPADYGIRKEFVPLFDIRDVVLQRSGRSTFHEDNQATIRMLLPQGRIHS
eukprot:10440765-Lingulodinium_polyedra.AAC.1